MVEGKGPGPQPVTSCLLEPAVDGEKEAGTPWVLEEPRPVARTLPQGT